MTWDKYRPDVRDALRDNPQIRDTIINMRDKGMSKEAAQRVSGAPYEVVDSIYKQTEKRGPGRPRTIDRDPDGNE